MNSDRLEAQISERNLHRLFKEKPRDTAIGAETSALVLMSGRLLYPR